MSDGFRAIGASAADYDDGMQCEAPFYTRAFLGADAPAENAEEFPARVGAVFEYPFDDYATTPVVAPSALDARESLEEIPGAFGSDDYANHRGFPQYMTSSAPTLSYASASIDDGPYDRWLSGTEPASIYTEPGSIYTPISRASGWLTHFAPGPLSAPPTGVGLDPLLVPPSNWNEYVIIGPQMEPCIGAYIGEATTTSEDQPQAHETTCKQCGKKFERPADLRKHEPVHANAEDRKHRCDICHAPFLYAKDVTRHKATAHPSDDRPAYFCPVSECSRAEGGKPFPRKDKLQDHMRTLHRLSTPIQPTVSSADSPVACYRCCKRFTGTYRKGNLARHQRWCTETERVPRADTTCTVCSRIFSRTDARKKHEWELHRIGSEPKNRKVNDSDYRMNNIATMCD